MKVLITICARGGSKGLLNKNIRPLANKPLIAHTINYAKEQNCDLVLSTDSKMIASVAKEYGLDSFFLRQAKLSDDKAGKLLVIKDAYLRARQHFKTDYDFVVDLDVTAPIRKKDDFKKALAQIVREDKEALLSATPARKSPYFNLVEIVKDELITSKKASILRRQDSPKCYDLNASIYVFSSKALLREDFFPRGLKSGLYIMDERCAFDIDSELDFKIVEFLLKEGLC